MVITTVARDPSFEKILSKLDQHQKEKIKKQLLKIIKDPQTGKPMRYARNGTREVYIRPFRLSYAYIPEEQKIIFLDIYHKDEQ